MHWISRLGRAGRTMAAVVMVAFGTELLLMLVLGRVVGWRAPILVALLDAIVLAVAIAPPLYFLVFRPLRKEFEGRLEAERHAVAASRLAVTDPLTGALNRRGVKARLLEAMAQADRYERPLALVMLDLDDLKGINDRHGHAAGDKALCQLVSVVQASLRSPDSLGRYGGDEFLLVLPETPLPAARLLGARIGHVLGESDFVVDGGRERLSVGFGAAEFQRGDSLEALLGRADRLLYETKRNANATSVGSADRAD